MSNQIVISSGAKVRSLEGVLTGTAGIVNSVPLGGANGVATLDALGKVPLSQLPASVVTYLGTWNAATNTPTLTNGVGDTGDLYICNVAGTVNFGAGPITFAAGDWVIYSGTEWQKSAGASGTVTSVALSESGDALTITGSPITTSGTINIGFAGTSGQYINGAGGLTTFPSLTGFVPYTGATANVDLGTFDLTADVITGATGSFASSGSSDTLAINHTSGSGIALNITKGGNGEGLYINKTSGSGNAATIIGTLNATTLVKNGGTSSQYLMADGSVSTGPDLTGYVPYTGATGNVNLGTNEITASNFVAETSFSTKILPSGVTFRNGYSTLSSIAGNFSITQAVSAGNLKAFTFDFSAWATNTSYTYTLPAANGTIALTSNLSSYVPYSGATSNVNLGTYNLTTTGNVNATNFVGSQSAVLGAGTIGGTLALFPYATYTTNDGYLNIVASSTTKLNLIFGQGSSVYKTAIFDVAGLTNSVNRTYALPDASGTLALTSDLSNYVTLTGASQTISSAKSFTSFPTTFKDVIIDGSGTSASGVNLKIATGGFVSAGGGYITLYSSASKKLFVYDGTSASTAALDFSSLTSAITRTFTYPDANGTLVLGTGTTNYLPKFTGASTLGNSLIFDDGTNVGIGTTSAAVKLDVNGGVRLADAYELQFGGSTASIYGSSSSNQLRLYTNNTERIRVTSTGNVGIGTSSPTRQLFVNSTAFFDNNGDGSTTNPSIAIGSTSVGISYLAGGNLALLTGATERMRITSAGNVLINQTSVNSVGVSEITYNGQTQVGLCIKSSHTDGFNTRFLNQTNGIAGSIYSTTSATTYNTSSDYRLKEDYKDINGLEKVSAIKVYDFKWKVDDSRMNGVIAHELAEVLPYAVVGKKDAVDEEGNIIPQGVDYSLLTPILIKAIQELNDKVSALENKS
jgi:hypothetical protein